VDFRRRQVGLARAGGADAWNRAQTPRVHGVAGANIVSAHGRKVNCLQPLWWEHCLGTDGCDIRRVLERGQAYTVAEGAYVATGAGGINKSSPILVICQFLFQISSLSQHT
jgi:hypothetical protein